MLPHHGGSFHAGLPERHGIQYCGLEHSHKQQSLALAQRRLDKDSVAIGRYNDKRTYHAAFEQRILRLR